jgi:soluble lytic murein transglycosylase-like protein
MPDEIRPGPVALGLRHGDERRHGDRRAFWRASRGRRRGDRRRATLRTLLMTAATLSLPHAVKTTGRDRLARPVSATRRAPEANVDVSIDEFRALAPERAYDAFIAEAARRYRVDPHLIRAVMRTESAFNPLVVSDAGAQGLMQLMPEVAKEMGVTDPFDPRENIMGGTRYLRILLDAHKGNLPLTLASYNAGPGAVAKFRNVPPFKETQDYVKRVTAAMKAARVAPEARTSTAEPASD